MNKEKSPKSNMKPSSSNPFAKIAKRMKQIKAKNYGKATIEALKKATKSL